jgi:hypothetical protein
MHEELNTLKSNEIWKIVPLQRNKKNKQWDVNEIIKLSIIVMAP